MSDRGPFSGGESLPLLASAGMGGVVAELALGQGAVGVAAGALAPVGVHAAHRLARRITGRWRQNVDRMLTVAADLLDPGLEILDERQSDYDARIELLARVIEGSARATLEAKIKAFGRLLADGLGDRGDIDEALLLASALVAIEAPHVAVLAHLDAYPGPPAELIRAGIDSSIGWRGDLLAKELPQVAGVIDAVLAVLAGQGLIRDLRGQTFEDLDRDYWQVAPLGRRCLFLLDEGDQGPE